jgi:phenylalanyl-tRNA synthetase beta chain
VLGVLGELHQDVCDRFSVPERTVAVEIALASLLASLPERVKVSELPRYPSILLDLAVIVPEDVHAAAVEALISSAGAPELASVRLFDVYTGDQVPDGEKSLAFALELRVSDRTMTDEEALAIRDRIVERLGDELGARLRG